MREKVGSKTHLRFRNENIKKCISIYIYVCLLPSNDIRTNRWSVSVSPCSSGFLGGPRYFRRDFTAEMFFLHTSFFFVLRSVQTNGKSRAVSRFKLISLMARPRIAIEINARRNVLHYYFESALKISVEDKLCNFNVKLFKAGAS